MMYSVIKEFEMYMEKVGVKQIFAELRPEIRQAICVFIDSDFSKDLYAPASGRKGAGVGSSSVPK